MFHGMCFLRIQQLVNHQFQECKDTTTQIKICRLNETCDCRYWELQGYQLSKKLQWYISIQTKLKQTYLVEIFSWISSAVFLYRIIYIWLHTNLIEVPSNFNCMVFNCTENNFSCLCTIKLYGWIKYDAKWIRYDFSQMINWAYPWKIIKPHV